MSDHQTTGVDADQPPAEHVITEQHLALASLEVRQVEILAGGLNSDNVWDAITHVRPAAIDVCSGVEAEPGRKDLDKLTRFMAIAARANALIASEEAV